MSELQFNNTIKVCIKYNQSYSSIEVIIFNINTVYKNWNTTWFISATHSSYLQNYLTYIQIFIIKEILYFVYSAEASFSLNYIIIVF